MSDTQWQIHRMRRNATTPPKITYRSLNLTGSIYATVEHDPGMGTNGDWIWKLYDYAAPHDLFGRATRIGIGSARTMGAAKQAAISAFLADHPGYPVPGHLIDA